MPINSMGAEMTPLQMGLARLRRSAALAAAGLALGGLAACDFLDPTNVENPQTTVDDLAQAQEPTGALLPGLRAQFARAIGAAVTTSDVASDNYSVQSTGLSAELDDPFLINPDVIGVNTTGGSGLYWNTQELRALSSFVIEQIAPEDETATSGQLAEAHYYRGMASLLQGENFSGVPIEEDAEPTAAADLLRLALADFNRSLQLEASGSFALPARAAIARTQRMLGDEAAASAAARAALQANPTFAFLQEYDENNLANNPYFFLVARATAEMQPLPRLDFLDPKYISFEAGIPYAKAEEMHLILAEVAIAAGNAGTAAGHVADAVALALTRGTEEFFDPDARKNSNLTIRPRDAEMLVQASPTAPFRAGLVQGEGAEVLKRGNVTNYSISGTSLRADSVRALTSLAEVTHAFWLARQEIHFLEGRRMSDLGIRLPITQRELDSSPVLDESSPFAKTVIPAYIPQAGRMDQFTPLSPYADPRVGSNIASTRITIAVDMNQVLTTNFAQASPFGR